MKEKKHYYKKFQYCKFLNKLVVSDCLECMQIYILWGKFVSINMHKLIISIEWQLRIFFC